MSTSSTFKYIFMIILTYVHVLNAEYFYCNKWLEYFFCDCHKDQSVCAVSEPSINGADTMNTQPPDIRR